MSHHRSAVGCMPVRPSDLSNCAPWFASQAPHTRTLRQCASAAAKQFDWPLDYAEAVSVRLLAWGRYLEQPRRADHLPVALTLLAAAATPLTAERGFDMGLLEEVARECAARVAAFNGTAA
jgi:hypothetical protein